MQPHRVTPPRPNHPSTLGSLNKRMRKTQDLIELDPDDKVPIADLDLYEPVIVGPTTTLRECLNLFQNGASHFAFISKNAAVTQAAVTDFHDHRHELFKTGATISKTHVPTGSGRKLQKKKSLKSVGYSHIPIGVITLEDIIEELLTEVSDNRDAGRLAPELLATTPLRLPGNLRRDR